MFDAIQRASDEGNKIEKARLKEKLYSFTPCVHVSNSRKYSDIVKFTGLMVLDFDKIDNAEDFKQYLFETYNFIYICWISPSKKGVKAIVTIPDITTVDEFKSYYYGLADEMEQYSGFDSSGQNCVLPLFQSMDREMLVNPFPFKWVDKGFKKNDFEKAEAPIIVKYSGEPKESIILKMINTGINKIIDNGHPQLRSICLAIGGYISSGYIDYSTAIGEIYNLIDRNNYLQKGISGYKRTARQMVDIGMTKPLYL